MSSSPRRVRLRLALAAALLGLVIAGVAAMVVAVSRILPRPGEVAQGVRVGGILVGPGDTPRSAAEAAAGRVLAHRITLKWQGETLLEASAAELGATVDVDDLARAAGAIGRRGDLVARVNDALEARRGARDLPVHVDLPVEPLAARLEAAKEERDTPPVAARLDFAHHAVTAHGPGRYLDVYATAEAVARVLVDVGSTTPVAVPVFTIAPRASSEVVAAADVSQVISRFETHFGFTGDQVGRAQNVRRAAEQMDGVVLMPGDVVSFNANVGPRSVENGFTEAPEIYKGEIRAGIGGGTCQVAGTLHAAAYLGGLTVVERASHSRPSGYIRMGLDATVVYPTVDLKLENPYDFPIVVHSAIDKGTLAFELRGARRPATVSFAAATVGSADYKRKIEEVATLAEGKVVLKQHGIRGYSVRKTRTIRLAGGGERVETTTDVYPPTFEIYQVAPGTDVDAVLPPLPDGGTDAQPPT